MKVCLVFLMVAAAAMAPASASSRPLLPDQLHVILQSYLKERGAAEHITAASVSVSLRPGDAHNDPKMQADYVTIALNSQPREKEDKIGDLMTRVLGALKQP